MHKPTRKQAIQAENDFMDLHGSFGACAIYKLVLGIEALCKTPRAAIRFGQKKWRATFAARHSKSLKL